MNAARLQPACRFTLAALVLAALGTPISAAPAAPKGPPDQDRVRAIAAMLPEAPRGVGPAIDDRQAWDSAARLPEAKGIVRRAEQEMAQPIPDLPDDLYLEFSRTGNRTRYERVAGRRHARVSHLVLAECLENRGRFLPAIEEAIRAVCKEKSWTLPAHDADLRNFKGTTIDVDLWVAHVSWTLATADHWLGDRLKADTRAIVRSELERRTFTPFEISIKTGKPRMWWITCTSNWNAVCMAGVTGSALAAIESRQRRALFLASAEKYIPSFLSGFTPDGYCSEGIGYWNYGFGHYAMLAETAFQATGGRLDWFTDPQVKQAALFGQRMEIAPDLYPAFADCGVNAKPELRLMAFLSRRLGLGMADVEKRGLLLAGGLSDSLFGLGLFGFPNSATAKPPAGESATAHPLRDWFADAGILICRPAPGATNALAVALKGGHNAEHHNHNDVGSFVVTLAGQMPLVDPGAETYTARTFSARRYESGLLNSWGHPVPRVAGKLQRSGRDAAGKVLKTEFTDQSDTLVLDLTSCYDVKWLRRLERTFVYSRQGRGSLTVTDRVEYDSPRAFSTALVTLSPWRREGETALTIGSGPSAIRAEIATDGPRVTFKPEEIKEDRHGAANPTRLGIELNEPVIKARITIGIAPAGATAN
jgi:hypothetical protein